MKMKAPILDKINAQVADLKVVLQSSRPQWTRGADAVTVEQQLNKTISKIIATELAQDPQLPPLHMLRPTEQREMLRALNNYTKQLTTQVLQDTSIKASNNKEDFNKKLTTARKFVAAFLMSLYALYDQIYIKKQRKKLRLLLAKADRKHKEEAAKLSPQETPRPEPRPVPVLIPGNMEDYALAEQLHILGLEVGANHDDINKAYQRLQEECTKQCQPVPVEAATAYRTLMATPMDRLLAMATITATEIRNLANHLKIPEMLDANHTVTFAAIKRTFIETNIQQVADFSPQNTPELRRIGLTMEKLERHYRATPLRQLHLGQELLGLQPTPSSSRLGQIPTLTPSSAKGV